MNSKFFLIILILLLISTLAYAGEKIITVATLKDYAPFCMVDEKYKINQIIPVGCNAIGFKGYSWDVLRESLHEMGYTIHLWFIRLTRTFFYEDQKASI